MNMSPFALSQSCLTKLQGRMYSLSFKRWALRALSSSIIYNLSKWRLGYGGGLTGPCSWSSVLLLRIK